MAANEVTLPSTFAYEMMLYLDPSSLLNFCSTNKEFRELCQNDNFWKKKVMVDFPENPNARICKPGNGRCRALWEKLHRTLTLYLGFVELRYYPIWLPEDTDPAIVYYLHNNGLPFISTIESHTRNEKTIDSIIERLNKEYGKDVVEKYSIRYIKAKTKAEVPIQDDGFVLAGIKLEIITSSPRESTKVKETIKQMFGELAPEVILDMRRQINPMGIKIINGTSIYRSKPDSDDIEEEKYVEGKFVHTHSYEVSSTMEELEENIDYIVDGIEFEDAWYNQTYFIDKEDIYFKESEMRSEEE